MMAKPMKTLELHYPMIQFFIINNITCVVTLFLVLRTSPFRTDEDEKINQLSFEGSSAEGPRENTLNKM